MLVYEHYATATIEKATINILPKIRQYRNVTSIVTAGITEVSLGVNISLIKPIIEYF